MARRIVHCTSVHQWDDVRIFHKMARSLASRGDDAYVVALDRKGRAEREFVAEGVNIHLLPGADIGSRLARVLTGGWRVAAKARSLGADIVHVHDPELIPFLFGGFGRKTALVYDAHEDLVGQIAAKPWIPTLARPLLRGIASLLELAALRADALVAATPYIAAKLGKRAIPVQNFPLLGEFATAAVSRGNPGRVKAVYAGGISRVRGIEQMIDAAALASEVEALHLAGTFQPAGLQSEMEARPGWSKVRFHGQLSRDALAELLAACDIGLVTLLPNQNYLNAQPTKLFEYLSAGLMVVASDFPAWHDYLAAETLAEFVDPTDPASIAEGLDRAARLPAEERERRRASGRSMIDGTVNWEVEFRKLVSCYERL